MVKLFLFGVVAFLLANAVATDSVTDTKYCLHNALAEGKSNAFAYCSVSSQIDMLSAQVSSLGTEVSAQGTDVSTLETRVTTLEVQNEILRNSQEPHAALLRLESDHGSLATFYHTDTPDAAFGDLVEVAAEHFAHDSPHALGHAPELTALLRSAPGDSGPATRVSVYDDRSLGAAFAAAAGWGFRLELEARFQTAAPTDQPTDHPTDHPTKKPTERPTDQPTDHPTKQPTEQSTNQPTKQPTDQPIEQPTDSRSVVATEADFQWLELQLPSGKSIGRLLYRASEDGDSASAFHAACDNQGMTIVLVKATNDYRFGGFAEVAWTHEVSYKAGAEAFLFGLSGGGRSYREKLDLKWSWTGTAYRPLDSYGPTFGHGHDLHVSDGCRGNTLSYTNGYAYEYPSAGRWALSGGTSYPGYFQCEDYEVFLVE